MCGCALIWSWGIPRVFPCVPSEVLYFLGLNFKAALPDILCVNYFLHILVLCC